MQVGRRSVGDEGIDVRDGNENANCPCGESLGDFNLIEIARLGVVDRGPQQPTQVAHPDIGRRRLLRRCDLRVDILPEFRIKPVLAQHALRGLDEIDRRPMIDDGALRVMGQPNTPRLLGAFNS